MPVYTHVSGYSIIGIDLANGKGIAGGDGTMPISWTAISDVASFLAHVLTSLPPSELEWRTFRIEGERAVSYQHFVMSLPSLSLTLLSSR